SLPGRGLGGVRLVLRAPPAGLVPALPRCFPGAGPPRCRVPFARPLLAPVPPAPAALVARLFRLLFSAPAAAAVHATWAAG
ncbi:IS256 family transposase, partial [Mycobacterium tuberculosis]|uniref:transposase n=1 Tax=Mycobacterium tuberculosis TaxID=1773 RepID=UPI000E3A7C47